MEEIVKCLRLNAVEPKPRGAVGLEMPLSNAQDFSGREAFEIRRRLWEIVLPPVYTAP